AVPGVKAVVQVPSGVAVVGEHFWAAKLGRDALEIDWDPGPGADLDTQRLREEFRAAAGTPGTKAAAAGDVDAALKSAAKTIKVVWTREDDIHGGYYRPMYVHRLRVGLGADGKPVAWRQTIVGQSILEGTPFAPMMIKNGIDDTSVEGVADSPYVKGTASHLVDLHSPKKTIPVLWLRSVGHSHTAFVMETFVDDLARAAGQEPLEYRRRLLSEHPRHLGVLNLAAEKAGWGRPLSGGRARGL